MNVEQLRDYKNWIGKTPHEILLLAQRHGGWSEVFKSGFPRWAHRIRNYFNVTPRSLKRVDADTSDVMLKRAKKFEYLVECARALQKKRDQERSWFPTLFPAKVPDNCPAGADTLTLPTFKEDVAIKGALSGDVYLDDQGRSWFQMSPGGTVYHYGKVAPDKTGEAIWATLKGQTGCPIFKLVSPDGTGGSCEVIIQNQEIPTTIITRYGPMPATTRSAFLGSNTTDFVEVAKLIVTDPQYIGTYNYGETIEAGFARHAEYDITPHTQTGHTDYIEPAAETTLHSRRFPATHGKSDLATEVGF